MHTTAKYIRFDFAVILSELRQIKECTSNKRGSEIFKKMWYFFNRWWTAISSIFGTYDKKGFSCLNWFEGQFSLLLPKSALAFVAVPRNQRKGSRHIQGSTWYAVLCFGLICIFLDCLLVLRILLHNSNFYERELWRRYCRRSRKFPSHESMLICDKSVISLITD